MKILQLTAENVKKLKIVDITPTDGLNQITGKNGSGKTSVLDSIWWALGGAKNIQDVPIRTGCETARIRLDLGDLVVERKFGKGAGLTVRPKATTATEIHGMFADKKVKLESPQDILDALVGRLTFDPLAFANKSRKDQYEELKSIANLEVDIEALKATNDSDFKRRTDINREAKAKHAQSDGVVIPTAPDRPIDESALIGSIQEAAESNASIERQKAARERMRRRVSVAIAMAANPKLRVLRVRDGSLLDEDGIAMLAKLANERDYQIWLERVDSTGKIGVVMEDGEVAN